MPTHIDISNHDDSLDLRLKVCKVLIQQTLVIVIVWGIYYANIGAQFALMNVVATTLTILFTLALFWRGRHWGARVFGFLSLLLAMMLTNFAFEPQIDTELFMFALIGTPFLFFSATYERKTFLALITLLAILTCLTIWLEWAGLHQFLPGSGFISSGPEADKTLNFAIRITVGFALILELGLFAYLQNHGERKTQQALRDANSAAKAKGEFLANMSHEIRTPMNGLIGMIEVLETTPLDANQNSTISTIRNSAFSLLRIIDDILDASKIEAGKLDVDVSRIELMPLVEGVGQTLMTMADSSKVQLRMLVDPATPRWVMADSGRLRQILLNVVGNAIKYSSIRLTGRPGVVKFSTLLNEDGSLLFEIRDNGIGIGEDIQRNLFQPFVQGESSSRRQVSGTGLGLVISKNLVELMGGSIDVRSEEGVGTTLRVTLNLPSAEGPNNLPDVSGIQLISLYFDEPDIRDGLAKIFAKSGATVLFPDNVDEAITMAQQHPDPSVFLLPNADIIASKALQASIEAAAPNAKFIVHSSERSAKFGMQNSNTYLIQIAPLMVSELLHAVAFLSGRKSTRLPTAKTENAIAARDDTPKTKRILVVEDNEINQAVMAKQLEILRYPHFIASNGLEGLEEWTHGQFDLVLTDCHMPIMDGFELTSAIRMIENDGSGRHTPIIAITANAMDGEAQRCLAAGMDAYLAKPVEMNALRTKLALMLPEDVETQSAEKKAPPA